jgi:small-conductance mechanosensitive channel
VAAESVLAEQVECPQESSDEEAATPNPMVQAQKDKNKQLRQRFIK